MAGPGGLDNIGAIRRPLSWYTARIISERDRNLLKPVSFLINCAQRFANPSMEGIPAMIIDPQSVYRIEKPHPQLLKQYILSSLLLGPLFWVALIPLYFRYHSMRYRFDEKGISMSWGILFHKEVNITYARIQDIHLTSHLLERWLGLARIQIQTASGSAKAEMVIEGLREYGLVRDFLYFRMRGLHQEPAAGGHRLAAGPPVVDGELAGVLREAAGELRAVRELLQARLPEIDRHGK